MAYWRNVSEVEAYTPPAHEGTFNRRLAGMADGMEDMEVIIGEMEPGGSADPHDHEDMEQSMYILQGKMHVIIGGEEAELGEGDIVWIPKKTMHEVKNIGEGNLKFVLMYSPPKQRI
ncbi:Cupin domain protein [Bhargavaea ginsengi]|uniref:Cupin domain protein n=1 Tax=Bhargavaea ginsengi TaxID=426757 RepID=A0A1H6USF6_9BACL|nr:cupin domain-containing protein [Bhargavaea ginsengi]SEI90965.1 Cupin domain protein [Bhargavaea ginsengi]